MESMLLKEPNCLLNRTVDAGSFHVATPVLSCYAPKLGSLPRSRERNVHLQAEYCLRIDGNIYDRLIQSAQIIGDSEENAEYFGNGLDRKLVRSDSDRK